MLEPNHTFSSSVHHKPQHANCSALRCIVCFTNLFRLKHASERGAVSDKPANLQQRFVSAGSPDAVSPDKVFRLSLTLSATIYRIITVFSVAVGISKNMTLSRRGSIVTGTCEGLCRFIHPI